MLFKDFIASAASNEPHAALAWAGISLLLPVGKNGCEDQIYSLSLERSYCYTQASNEKLPSKDWHMCKA